MSKQGIEFLEQWIDDHVSYQEKDGNAERATALANECRAAASAQGLSVDDMEPQYGTVEQIIFEAMHYAEDA